MTDGHDTWGHDVGHDPQRRELSEPLAIRWSRPLPEGAQPSSVTVSRDAAGRWFVSILVNDPTIRPLPRVEGTVASTRG